MAAIPHLGAKLVLRALQLPDESVLFSLQLVFLIGEDLFLILKLLCSQSEDFFLLLLFIRRHWRRLHSPNPGTARARSSFTALLKGLAILF